MRACNTRTTQLVHNDFWYYVCENALLKVKCDKFTVFYKKNVFVLVYQ